MDKKRRKFFENIEASLEVANIPKSIFFGSIVNHETF